jgi:spore germination cell wall hydrolase CwlJ-like protein
MHARFRALAILAALFAVPASARSSEPAHARGRDDTGSVSCMAKSIYYEARGESPTGMVAVGMVVMNRANGRTPCEVVAERVSGHCQFSWACAPHGRPGGAPWLQAQAVAMALVEHRPTADPTAGATHFSRCEHRMRGPYALTARIGAHCFYRQGARADSACLLSASYDLVQDADRPYGWAVVLRQGGARIL